MSSILSALLAKIQVLMVQKDIAALSSANYVPDSGTWYYIVFFLIGIVGYFCVPTVHLRSEPQYFDRELRSA